MSTKYDFKETSQAETLAQQDVEEVRLNATFALKTEGKRVGIVDGTEIVAAARPPAQENERRALKTASSDTSPCSEAD